MDKINSLKESFNNMEAEAKSLYQGFTLSIEEANELIDQANKIVNSLPYVKQFEKEYDSMELSVQLLNRRSPYGSKKRGSILICIRYIDSELRTIEKPLHESKMFIRNRVTQSFLEDFVRSYINFSKSIKETL
jgi:hypothetical protein